MVPYPSVEGNETLNHLAEEPGHQYSPWVLYFAYVDVFVNARAIH